MEENREERQRNAGEPGGTPEEHGRASSSVHSLLNCGIVVLDTSQHDFHHLVVFCWLTKCFNALVFDDTERTTSPTRSMMFVPVKGGRGWFSK